MKFQLPIECTTNATTKLLILSMQQNLTYKLLNSANSLQPNTPNDDRCAQHKSVRATQKANF